MGNLDPTKIAIVMVVALLVLGPEKLPGFTRQAAAWWREFQKVKARIQSEVNGAVGQVNGAIAPVANMFGSEAGLWGGLVQSVFTSDGEVQTSDGPQAKIGKSIPPSAVARQDARWGEDEAESGYRFGDPRLN